MHVTKLLKEGWWLVYSVTVIISTVTFGYSDYLLAVVIFECLKAIEYSFFFLKPHFSACFLKIFDIKDTYVTMILPITCFAINYCCILIHVIGQ